MAHGTQDDSQQAAEDLNELIEGDLDGSVDRGKNYGDRLSDESVEVADDTGEDILHVIHDGGKNIGRAVSGYNEVCKEESSSQTKDGT